METVLNCVAAAVLFSPALVLLAAPVVFALSAIVIGFGNALDAYLFMRDKLRSGWKEYAAAYRKAVADSKSRHPV